ncbi:hypothetical protein EV401DRAFT_2017052 [Pisolithus croceorrhizus]|nr:hypothetical protein EV401DRAFT_2017052 [Pisolithus croceorrhizus]
MMKTTAAWITIWRGLVFVPASLEEWASVLESVVPRYAPTIEGLYKGVCLLPCTIPTTTIRSTGTYISCWKSG